MRVFLRRLTVFSVICVLLLTSSARGEMDYLRIIAHDDSPQYQRQKLRARAILRQNHAHSMDGEEICRLLEAHGISAHMQIRPFAPGFPYPKGDALCIILGEGRGRNWFTFFTSFDLISALFSMPKEAQRKEAQKKSGVSFYAARWGTCVAFPLISGIVDFFTSDFP